MSITQVVTDTEKLKYVDELNERIAALVERGEGIRVVDAATDLEAKQFELDCKGYEKAVDLYADADIQEARERASKLVAAKKMLLDPILKILGRVKSQRRWWEEQERAAAEKEQKAADKKCGEPIQIRPSIPTLQGTQSRRLYKAKVNDPDAVLEAWAKARQDRTKKGRYRAMFLRSYIDVNEVAVQAAARSQEGWEKLRAEKIPGIEFWTE